MSIMIILAVAFMTCSSFGWLQSSELQSPSRLMESDEQGIDVSQLPSSYTPEDQVLKEKKCGPQQHCKQLKIEMIPSHF
jgi:hypothetical protein